jgi:type IV pilus assembly protein PilQ
MPKQKNKLLITALLVLAACTGPADLNIKESGIETDAMINKDRFIAQSAMRNQQEAGYGPIVDTSRDSTLREDARTYIGTEEAPNYDEITPELETHTFPIDMNVENMDIRTLAKMLSEITGVNFLVSDEVKSQTTAKVQGVEWTRALESVLKMKSLAKSVDMEANIVRIHDHNTVMQIEDFERKRKENMQRAMLLKQASEPMRTEIFKLYYTDPKEVKDMLEGVLGAANNQAAQSGLRSVRPEINLDKRMNMLIVKARDEDMQIVQRLIKEVDSRTKQVFIEAFIVEVTDGFERELGTRLGLRGAENASAGGKNINGEVGGVAGTQGQLTLGDVASTAVNLAAGNPFGGIGFLLGVGSAADLKLELSAMEQRGLSKVISNPKIFTIDNQEAVIFQGTEVPFQTVSQNGQNVQFKEAGLKLAVRPTVVGDGNLLMNIKVNKDTADTTLPNPPINKSEIKTSLVSKNGAIVVIGGIYDESKSQNKDQVPGLGNVPAVGRLFSRDSGRRDRRELMVFIAPRIL